MSQFKKLSIKCSKEVAKTIYITGASGLVGRYLVNELITSTNYNITAISSTPEVVKQRHLSPRLTSIGYSDFFAISNNLENRAGGNLLIHSAFTRKNDYGEVKRGIDLAQSVFSKCVELGIEGVLNISSRSIYVEPDNGSLNTENSPLNLGGPITLGKYTVELLAEAILGMAGIAHSSLRLASVNELKTDNNMVRPLNVFVDNVVAGKPIRVIGGMQVMSFIDPRDVATAIVALLSIPCEQWKVKYNIGTGWMCTDTLLNMAKIVVARGENFGYSPVDINVEEKEVNQRAGLDISRLTADTGWTPKISLTDMIDALFEMKIEQNNN